MKLMYPGTPIIVNDEDDLEGSPLSGRLVYELPSGDCVVDVFDFYLDDNEPRRVTLRTNEFRVWEHAPDVHEDCYDRGLFDD